MKARDVMTTSVVCVSADERVDEIAKRLLEKKISAVFVVDDEGRPVGIVSEGDLMHRVEAGTERARSWWLRLLANPRTLANEYVKSHGLKATDVMTRPLISVSEHTDLAEIATLLETRGIKRVPVIRDGWIVGVVSRANLLRAWASVRSWTGPAKPLDQAIRAQLIEELKAQPWASAEAKSIIVSDGVVHLWGIVATEEERAATRVAAERIEGVQAVEDHLVVMPIVGT
jgi:CBS domain-containing protein